MTKDEFIETAKQGGYATMPVIRKYVKLVDKDEYGEDDLAEVYRRDDMRYYLEHKDSENNSTTKKYTVYNSHKTGGSY